MEKLIAVVLLLTLVVSAPMAGSADTPFVFTKITDSSMPGNRCVYSLSVPAVDGEAVAFHRCQYFDLDSGIYKFQNGEIQPLAVSPPSNATGLRRFGPPSFNGGTVAFSGQDPYSPVYAGIFTNNPSTVVADNLTPIPLGSDTFYVNGFRGIPSVANGLVAFIAGSSPFYPDPIYGVYTGAPGSLSVVADTLTNIPGGTGTFTVFGPRGGLFIGYPVAFDGRDTAFIAGGANGQIGVYRTQNGSLRKVVDNRTIIPGQVGTNFADFYSIAIDKGIDKGNVALVGGNYGGVYDIGPGMSGVYKEIEGSLQTVADAATIPPGRDNHFYNRFGSVSISNGTVVLTDNLGVYTDLGGSLQKVVDLFAPFDGKAVGVFDIGADAISGDRIGFHVSFADGSEAIYIARPDSTQRVQESLASSALPEEIKSILLSKTNCGFAAGILCRLILVTGSPTQISQNVNLSIESQTLSFDYQFLTLGGTLHVTLDGVEIGSVTATDTAPAAFNANVDGSLSGRQNVALGLRLDGPSGSAIALGDIRFSGLVNGDFQTGDLTGWTGIASTAGFVGVVAQQPSDTTPPSIVITSPASTFYLLNQSVAASYSCQDSESGVASCIGSVDSGNSIDTASVGAKTFNVTATDNAGNTTSQLVSYQVAYNVCVLYDQTKSHKSGSVAPIKLQLCDVNAANTSVPGIIVHATGLTKKDNTAASSVAEDAGNANPNNDFRYDAALGGYIYNLSTKGLTSGTWALSFIVSGDPIIHSVEFDVK